MDISMTRLRLNPSVVLAPAEDGYLAYHVALEQLHRLNPTATLLLELCDGTRTEADVLEIVAPLVGAERVAGCAEWLRRAIEQQLLVADSDGIAEGAKTASEWHDLAGALRRRDRVLAAYMCQRRATELQPDQPRFWYSLGELAHIVGRREEARAAYQ